MRRVIVLAGAALFLAACVTVSKTVLTEAYVANPVPAGEVTVLLASMNDSIPSDCERVALLHASGDEDLTEESQMFDKLREEAGKLGANAVYVQNMEDPGTGERVVSAIFGTSADRDSDAVALYCPKGL